MLISRFYTQIKEVLIYTIQVFILNISTMSSKFIIIELYEISRAIVSKDTITPSDLLLFTSKQS